MPPPLDLSLQPTDDLVTELLRRHVAAAFVGLTFEEEVATYLHGSAVSCSGLLTAAQNEILWYSFQDRRQDTP